MKRGLIHTPALLVTAFAVGAVAIGDPAASAQPQTGSRILLFTKTTGFRHTSIPAAVRAIRGLAAQNRIAVDVTEDSGVFAPATLRRYRAVVFLLTSGDILSPAQEQAFQRYFRRGGGFAGIHSAADTEPGWPWYDAMLGARFRAHPQIQRGVVVVRDRRHPSTVGLPRRWSRTDEWYNFARTPRPAVHVLADLDERSYSPGNGAMGADHPIAWTHKFQGGRAWYTGGGHTDESYAEPLFRKHLIGGLRYAAGLTPPAIVSVSHAVRARRLVVAVRYRSCEPCAGRLVVIARGRSATVAIPLARGVGNARSAQLPRGRWPFSVVLRDPKTGVERALRRSVRVS
jgi:cytochrome c